MCYLMAGLKYCVSNGGSLIISKDEGSPSPTWRQMRCGITSIYQATNAHIISHKTHLKHFKTLRHVSILSYYHQGALFLAKVILQYSQFNSYLQTRCCGSISCCVGMRCGAVARCASYDAHLATAPQHNMI